MSVLTAEQLYSIWKCSVQRAEKLVTPLNTAMKAYQIDTPLRMCAFLAQVGHESGRGIYLREMWGPTAAQKRYEGRLDLGNTEPGDGFRYRGRGLIQITGRANYRDCGKALGIDLEESPELLEQPYMAAMSAGWFWSAKGCNELADKEDFRGLTRRINGGLNGYDERLELYRQAKGVIACALCLS